MAQPGTQGGNEPKEYTTAQKEKRVVELRLQGLEFDEIARQVGYANHGGACKAWKRVIARLPVIETHEARLNVEMRLNRMLALIWPMVQRGEYEALDRALAIEKERRALMGLSKPPSVDAGAGDQLAAILVEIANTAARTLGDAGTDATEDESA